MKLIMENWRNYQRGLFEERGAPIKDRPAIHRIAPMEDLFDPVTGKIDNEKSQELIDLIDQAKSSFTGDPERDEWLKKQSERVWGAINSLRDQVQEKDPKEIAKFREIERAAAEVRALIRSRQTDVDTVDAFRDTISAPSDPKTVQSPPPIPNRTSSISESTLQLLEDVIVLELIEEGFLQDLGARSSNVIKGLALAAAILAPMAPVSKAEAAPKNKVERMLIRGEMTAKQKKKLVQNDAWLNLTLDSLNDHINAKGAIDSQLQLSSRDTQLKILGATTKDFPLMQKVSKQELKTFLETGKGPGKKKPKEKSFGDQVDDFAHDVGQGIRKGLKWVDRESPVGQNTGWFDDSKAPKR